MTSRRLVELAGPALASTLTADSIVVLPTGSIEHHGPHLPLATDLLMADILAAQIVDGAVAAGLDAWLLPALSYTKSDEHAWAPGTIWVGAPTLLDTVVAIGRGVAATPARTLVFYNGHGGNVALLQVALRELRVQFGLRTFLMNVAIPAGDTEQGFGIHGGHGETSLAMHLRPDLVDLTGVRDATPRHLSRYQRIGFAGAPVQFGWTSDDFGTGGVIGDPTGATAEYGAELATQLVAEGIASLAEIATFDPGPPS
ncbi:creatininase family protein [Pseudolysinimonas sp.]|uniref:creatininase family protein n=1 Tax=Pseudolysinimonas sp. TaxID=2680009 RepID=UPI00286CBBBD|nr:creatininase family protein [Pseudolysinimonas sp.]